MERERKVKKSISIRKTPLPWWASTDKLLTDRNRRWIIERGEARGDYGIAQRIRNQQSIANGSPMTDERAAELEAKYADRRRMEATDADE